MSEKNVLRNSLLGGYKKSDVIEYMDTVLENNEKRVMELEEKIATLSRQKEALPLSKLPDAKHVVEKEEDTISYKNNQTIFAQLPFESKRSNSQDSLSIRQQMKLPEGSYQILEGNKIVHIPEPMPTYQTKGKRAPMESGTKTSTQPPDAHAFLPKTKPQYQEKVHESAELTGKESLEYITTQASKVEIPNGGARSVSAKQDYTLENSLMARVKELTAELEKEQQEKQVLATKLKFYHEFQRDNALESSLTARVKELTTELGKERQEKQALAAKLEFCNDLLFQLCKK